MKALFKIVKKHDKVSLSFRYSKKTLEELSKSQIANDMGKVCVCHMFMKTFGIASQGYMQRQLGEKIEKDYVKLYEQLLNCEPSKALEKLRLRGDISDPPMSQSDTFTLGCLVGCMLPMLLYCFIAVVSGNHVTTSPRWPFVWIHFRMTFLCILHATLWAWNIYVFKTFNINYCLIFDIYPGSQLHFNRLLKLCAGATVWSLLWLTVSLQQIVEESIGSPEFSQYSWASALEEYVTFRFRLLARVAIIPCIIRYIQTPFDTLCMVAVPGRLVVLSFVALVFLPLPLVVFGTRRFEAARNIDVNAAATTVIVSFTVNDDQYDDGGGGGDWGGVCDQFKHFAGTSLASYSR